jgi:sporulation protein YlmC with PRC-barrel domain
MGSMIEQPGKARTRAAITDHAVAGTLLGARDLIEDDIYDATGRCLGEIEDIVLDIRTGCVRYAVVALGGVLGIGRKRYAVPWSALTPDAKHRRCLLDVNIMRLMALPIADDIRRSGASPDWDRTLGAQ